MKDKEATLLLSELSYSAGTQTVVRGLVRALGELGVRHGVWGQDSPSLENPFLFKVSAPSSQRSAFEKALSWRHTAESKANLLRSNQHRQIINDHGVDAVFLPWIFDVPAFAMPARTGAMVMDLNWHRFPENFEKCTAELDRLFQTWVEMVDVLFPISEFTQRELIQAFPKAADKCKMVPHGATIRALSGRDRVAGRLLYPASLHVHKDHRTLLQALKLVQDRGVDFELHLCGPNTERLSETPTNEGWIGNTQRAYSAIRDGVQLRGMTEQSALDDLYETSHLVVLPTQFEGFGLPLLESFERGCRVVATDIPPFREQAKRYGCEDWVTFVQPENPNAMADAIQDELQRPPSTPAEQEVHERVERWTWRDVATAYLDALIPSWRESVGK